MDCMYIVVRHGSNAANQHKTPRVVLGSLTTKRLRRRDHVQRRVAIEAFQASHHETLYNNQWIELIPRSRASNTDLWCAFEADSYAQEYGHDCPVLAQ